MPRRRYKKSQKPTPEPVFPNQADRTSPVAQSVPQYLTNGGVDYVEQNLIRFMSDSAQLADEPEFVDLYLDEQKTVKVTEHWLNKYDKRLAAAREKSEDDYHQVLDQMRIEAIKQLTLPAFRNDVNHRLQLLSDRLLMTKDMEKWELVMLLKRLLEVKRLPWGVCGLIVAIYERTVQQVMQHVDAEMSLFDSITEALKADGRDDDEISEMIEHPEEFEQVAQNLFNAHPDLMQRAEKQAWEMVDAFEDELAKGNVDLALFSEDELYLPFQQIEEELGLPFAQVEPSEEMQQRIFNAIQEAIPQIMTPDRIQRLRDDVERISKSWMRVHHKWAAALHFELDDLAAGEYEESSFVLAAFIGQISRLGESVAKKRKKKRR